jgi:hypothetical protein
MTTPTTKPVMAPRIPPITATLRELAISRRSVSSDFRIHALPRQDHASPVTGGARKGCSSEPRCRRTAGAAARKAPSCRAAALGHRAPALVPASRVGCPARTLSRVGVHWCVGSASDVLRGGPSSEASTGRSAVGVSLGPPPRSF